MSWVRVLFLILAGLIILLAILALVDLIWWQSKDTWKRLFYRIRR